MRKIPPGAEASSILVGQVDFLEKPVSAFVRLAEAVFLSDLTEVPIPSRFIYILLGPKVCNLDFIWFGVRNYEVCMGKISRD